MHLRVTKKELERDNQVSVPLPEGGGYLGWMGVFHELHCVVRFIQFGYSFEREPNDYIGFRRCCESGIIGIITTLTSLVSKRNTWYRMWVRYALFHMPSSRSFFHKNVPSLSSDICSSSSRPLRRPPPANCPLPRRRLAYHLRLASRETASHVQRQRIHA